MATGERRFRPSTWEVTALAAVAVWLVIPLLVVGATMLTGAAVDLPAPGDHYWVFVVAGALVAPLAAPYGAVLGIATVPFRRRIGAGYATAVPLSSGVDRASHLRHVVAATLLAVPTTFAAVATLATRSWLADPVLVPSSGHVLANPAVSLAMLWLGGSAVAGAFLAAQCHRCDSADGSLDGRVAAVYAAYALALLPSPLVALALLARLLGRVDVWTFVL